MTYRSMRKELCKLDSKTIISRLAKISPTICFGDGEIDKTTLIEFLQDWEVSKVYHFSISRREKS